MTCFHARKDAARTYSIHTSPHHPCRRTAHRTRRCNTPTPLHASPHHHDPHIHIVYEKGQPEPRTVAPRQGSYSVTVSGLKPNTEYMVRVAAVNSLKGKGSWAASTAKTDRRCPWREPGSIGNVYANQANNQVKKARDHHHIYTCMHACCCSAAMHGGGVGAKAYLHACPARRGAAGRPSCSAHARANTRARMVPPSPPWPPPTLSSSPEPPPPTPQSPSSPSPSTKPPKRSSTSRGCRRPPAAAPTSTRSSARTSPGTACSTCCRPARTPGRSTCGPTCSTPSGSRPRTSAATGRPSA